MFKPVSESLRRFGRTLLISAFFALFLLPCKAWGYAYETHGFLTEQTIGFYNNHFSEKISSDLFSFLIDGSRREDDTPRYINHFFDPVYQRGYEPDVVIDAYPLAFASAIEKVVNWVSSKQWANDPSQQNRLVYKATAGVYPVASVLDSMEKAKLDFGQETDFSWTAAKQYWLKGEKQKAMFALGHVLHLIQDASVPDHTRNDGHIGDSPYENWTSRFDLANPDRALSQRLIGKTPIMNATLGGYFDGLAKYSNNNFYSRDTIGINKGYQDPQPLDYEKIELILYSLNRDIDGVFRISFQPINTSVLAGIDGLVSIDDNRVMSDYWSRLSTKSVQYGAGAINLFFEELENEQIKEPDLAWYQKIRLWLTQQRDSFLGGQILPEEDIKENINDYPQISALPAVQVPVDDLVAMTMGISPGPSPSIPLFSFLPLVSVTPSPSTPFYATQYVTGIISDNIQSPQPSPSPDVSPQLDSTPEASVEPSMELSPEPLLSLEPSLIPSPTPDYQSSDNEYFDDVAWYFDTELQAEAGGVLTIELTLNQLFSGYDYHAIMAAWNSDFVLSDGEKSQGGQRPILKYNISTGTSLIIDQTAQDYGMVNSLWNFNGDPSASSSGEFPRHLKMRPTTMMTNSYQFLSVDMPNGITRQAIEQKLGRQIGQSDFITLAYWPIHGPSTPAPDGRHYHPSFLENGSEALVLPTLNPVNQIRQLRWGVDSSAETGYSLEFEYFMPIQEIFDQFSYGTEIRFHLNQEAGYYFDFDPNLGVPGFLANGVQNLVSVNYGFLGNETCDYWSRSEPKSGMRFVYDGCGLSGFKRSAYQYNHLPHIEHPTSGSWLIKLPILVDLSPKSVPELNSSDFLTVSLWSYEVGPNTGLYLRQVDSRRFYYQSAYQPLNLLVLPEPSFSPEPQSVNVVINEVAWMGTASSASDEWLELYNASSSAVDLTGWILCSQSGSPEIILSSSIFAGGYYLLERTGDDTVYDVSSDQIFTGAINNICEVFELVDNSGSVVDKTVCNGEAWPAGDNDTKFSMERIDPGISGEDAQNWQTNNGIVKNGHDVGGNEINGTPKAKNSAGVSQ